MTAEQALLEADGLSIYARTRGGSRRTIVSRLDLRLHARSTLAIVGESGSGKSLTARALIGLLPPGIEAEGSVRYRGEEILQANAHVQRRARGAHLSMLLQDPFTMLSPVRRCGAQIGEMLLDAHGRRLRGRARDYETARRLAEVGLPADVARKYPFELSGGMSQRVALAAALARDPKVLIADEPSTALDVSTQKEILELLQSLQTSRGMGIVFITHDLRVAFTIAERAMVLYAGAVLETAPTDALAAEPLHPYSLGLLLSEPDLDHRHARLEGIPGTIPPAGDVEDECAFATRCAWKQAVCVAVRPSLVTVGDDRRSACVRLSEIRTEMQYVARAEREAEVANRPAAASDVVLAVEGLSKSFPLRVGKSRDLVLDGVTLDIGAGECVGLVGESGSGKTTLARCILGLETADQGGITIAGIDASDYRILDGHSRRTVRRAVQMVFQNPYASLNPARTVGATIFEALAVRESRPTAALRDEMLARVGLSPTYANRLPVALSGGERQRVAIARALAVRPQLLVCDEPVSGLDVSVQAQILSLFRSLQEDLGLAYLFITHDLAVVRQMADRVTVLKAGKVVESGTADDVLTHPRHPYTKSLMDAIPRLSPEPNAMIESCHD